MPAGGPQTGFSASSGGSQARASLAGAHITIHVTVQGGADARATGQAVGQSAAAALRARLFDEAG